MFPLSTRKSIITRLTFYVGCSSLLIFAGIVFFFVSTLRETTLQRGKDYIDLRLEATQHSITALIDENINAVNVLKASAITLSRARGHNWEAVLEELAQSQMRSTSSVLAIGFALPPDEHSTNLLTQFFIQKGHRFDNTAFLFIRPQLQALPELSAPFFVEVNGERQLVTLYSSPIVDRKSAVGIMYGLLSLKELQTVIEKVKPYNSGYLGFYSNDSTYIYYPKTERIGTKMADRPGNEERAEALRQGHEFVRGDFMGSTTQSRSYSKLIPVYFSTITEPWGLQVTISLPQILALVETQTYQVIGIGLLALIALMAGVLILLRNLVRQPLRSIRHIASDLSNGILDKRLDMQSNDEIGDTAKSLNQALDVIVEKTFWYESLLNAIPNPILVTDMHQKRTFANKAALQLFSTPVFGNYASETAGAFPHTERCEMENCAVQALLSGQDSVFFIPDGHKKTYSIQASHLIDTNNLRSGFIEIITDVTELVLLKNKAEEASKSKSDFLARMSHEIRTPMNAIMGMIYLCLQTPMTEQQKDYLTKTSTATKNLLVILNDILDFSKIEAGKFTIENEHFSLRETTKLLQDMFMDKAREKHLDFSIHLAQDIPDVFYGGGTRLLQVLINLCSNALKFTQEGSVVVSVTCPQQTAEGAALQFDVTDTGIGIPEEKQSVIFDPFEQSEGSSARKFDGTGLGLAICKNLVELMGGKLFLTSTPNRGSTFSASLSFPFGDKTKIQIPGAGAASAEGLNQPLSGVHVLLVEDNIINQEIASELLHQFGATVSVAENGKEAVNMTNSNTYDVILMDIAMPEMDGLEATHIIRLGPSTSAKTTPIIAMTAHALVGDREKSLAAGMNDHITKPIDPDDLLAKLQTWTNRRTAAQ